MELLASIQIDKKSLENTSFMMNEDEFNKAKEALIERVYAAENSFNTAEAAGLVFEIETMQKTGL